MDNQQCRVHYDVPGVAVSSNMTLLNPLARNENLRANYTVAQVALLLMPSVVFLLLFPVRVLRLHRATLKVMPNSVGVIKVVCRPVMSSRLPWRDVTDIFISVAHWNDCSN